MECVNEQTSFQHVGNETPRSVGAGLAANSNSKSDSVAFALGNRATLRSGVAVNTVRRLPTPSRLSSRRSSTRDISRSMSDAHERAAVVTSNSGEVATANATSPSPHVTTMNTDAAEGALSITPCPGTYPPGGAHAPSRDDRDAVCCGAIRTGLGPGAFSTFAESMRATVSRPHRAPSPTASPNPLGGAGGDIKSFPEGRDVDDDVASIELQAIAVATNSPVTRPLIPDNALADVSGQVTGVGPTLLCSFPYLGTSLRVSTRLDRKHLPCLNSRTQLVGP